MENLVNFWRDKRVFVTGATGLVGAWLVKALVARGAEIVALIRDADPQSELLRSGDIRRIAVVNGRLEDFATLERAINDHEPDTVFHLAAQTIVGAAHRNPLENFESNIRGTYHLLEACRRGQAFVRRVVVASSDKAYGTAATLPYVETMPLQGQHPYEVAKSCADLLTSAYHHTYGLPVAIARCGNIYGGGDLNWSRIVPGTIRSLWRGERPIIRSDGTFVRDYLYVEDVVEAYLQLAVNLDRPGVAGEGFNFSPERPLTVLELVERIQLLMDCQHIPLDVRNTAVGEIHSQYLDASKAKARLNWTSRWTLDDGLRATIAWYQNFLG
ncbi:GDP-mannose 4,6-dehydratase [Chloracidobacterium validum]|uniref:GDP-mannose 4,6-dehydratase n=1 Tax=Chloracidobacterium validum TaxID=2821543 RepID=A0ABX8BBM2_9BACT|nr:GDP-mannose 4,6-dehydratase [Chloracidobacterium validum]QUW04331.1 GDP-mannose 4,6-dehydratase [Chloracidobacterium validum]